MKLKVIEQSDYLIVKFSFFSMTLLAMAMSDTSFKFELFNLFLLLLLFELVLMLPHTKEVEKYK